jgi:heat shock protein HslJ
MHLELLAPWFRRRSWVLAVLAVVGAAAALATERSFPFDQELLLDTAPMRGSKRIPGLEVQSNGWATIDLWCASGRGRVRVDGQAISIVPHSMEPAACPPERMQRDADMLSVLTQVTTWRREGDAVVLIGPQTLRYRPSSH